MIGHPFLFLYQIFRHFGLLGVFTSMFLENIAIPLPVELGYLAAVAMLMSGARSLTAVLFVLTAGHVTGSLIAYGIGRKGDTWLHKRFASSERFQQLHETLTSWYQRYGNLTVFGTRFIGYIRPWSSFVAGFADFPPVPFLFWTTFGSLLFNVLALYGAWILILTWKRYVPYHFFIALIIFVFSLAILLLALLQRKKA